MKRFEPGFAGHDSMREKAERMFREQISSGPSAKASMSTQTNENMRYYKKGGHVHPLGKNQKDLHLGRRVDMATQKKEKLPGNKYKHGGHVKKYNLGGAAGGMPFEMPTGIAPRGVAMSSYRHGGRAHHKYDRGGDVYERQMVGERPTRKMHHFDYEANLEGEHPVRPEHYRKGGMCKMAMGGVGKIRHKEATAKGKPIKRRGPSM